MARLSETQEGRNFRYYSNQKTEPVYALGTHLSYDDNLSSQRNFFDKLAKLQKTLNFWSQRDISVYGRINIVKTLALSKVILICLQFSGNTALLR